MPDTVLSDYNAATATTVATVGKENKRLFDFIRRRVRTDEDAEDILQDVFLQLTSSYNVTAPIEQLTSWLFTVARNRIIDWYRKKRPTSFTAYEDPEEGPASLEEILFDPGQHPDDIYDRSLFWREFADALDDLPDEQREVFVQHELEGKSFKEIAGQTGEPVNTLLSRKRYAVLHLRERLQEYYEEI